MIFRRNIEEMNGEKLLLGVIEKGCKGDDG